MGQHFGRFKLKNTSAISKKLITLSLALCVLLLQSASFSMDINTANEAIKQIEADLENFQRDNAYENMKALKESLDFSDAPETYLENLALLVKFEKLYGLYSDMVGHTIELYDLTEDSKFSSYRIIAIDALAYYDYLNYDNSKAAEKIAEISEYTNIGQSIPYKLNLALLKIDERDFETALRLYEEVIAVEEETPGSLDKRFNELTIIYQNIGAVYFEQDLIEKAIEYNLIALSLIGTEDYDFLVDIKLTIANLYYLNGEFEKARQTIDELYSDYEKTSKLFEKVLSINAIKILEADLAYDAGDYKKSSDLYFELSQRKDNSEVVEENIEAKNAVNQFESSQTNKQLSLLEQLADEQLKKNEAQKRYLTAAIAIIILLSALIVSFVLMLRWYYKQRRRLYQLSITDQLTQLYNRRMIIEEFERVEVGTKCIALMDIDHFKHINDHYGHVVGDKVLIRIAETIKNSLRNQDVVGRYGGEEFLAIIDTDDMEIAIEITERIRTNVANIEWEYPDMVTTISIGLTKVTHRGDILLAEADHLLYQSKANGRNLLTYEKT